jgi:CRISPR-associated protein Cmr4
MPEQGRKVSGALLSLHAQTALHPGAGTALGTVDLPVQRERHTQWPTIAGSALKGILRDACRENIAIRPDLDQLARFDDEPDKPAERKGKAREKADATLELNELFGPPTAGSHEFGGALSITDARLLAFPVRSLKGVFAWVSCPAVLQRLERDAVLAGKTLEGTIPDVANEQVVVPEGCPCLVSEHIILEEFEFKRSPANCGKLAEWITLNLFPDTPSYAATRTRFQKHFLLLSDDDFTHFAKHATEVAARIGLDYETKTVKTGALFYQEFLPAETLFYAVVLANSARSRNGKGKDGTAILKTLEQHVPSVLQVGGDETTGKGLCAVRLTNGKAGG